MDVKTALVYSSVKVILQLPTGFNWNLCPVLVTHKAQWRDIWALPSLILLPVSRHYCDRSQPLRSPQSFPHTQFAETSWPAASWPSQDLLQDLPYTCFSNFSLKYWLASTLPNQINFLWDRLKVMLQIMKAGYREWTESKQLVHEWEREWEWAMKIGDTTMKYTFIHVRELPAIQNKDFIN